MKKGKHIQKLVRKLVELGFKDGKIIESQVTKAIMALRSLPKHQAIEGLLQYLKELKRLERNHTMYIETVISLNSSEIKKIKGIVEKKVKITKVVTKINSEIFGGFKLRIGDEIWDESILGKINQVKEAIISGRYN